MSMSLKFFDLFSRICRCVVLLQNKIVIINVFPGTRYKSRNLEPMGKNHIKITIWLILVYDTLQSCLPAKEINEFVYFLDFHGRKKQLFGPIKRKIFLSVIITRLKSIVFLSHSCNISTLCIFCLLVKHFCYLMFPYL